MGTNTDKSVTELSASDRGTREEGILGLGLRVRRRSQAGSPRTAATSGWRETTKVGTVTELGASDGAGGPGLGYGVNGPEGVASDGTHVWVADPATTTVTELNASIGAAGQARPCGRRTPMGSPRTAPTSGWRTPDGDTVTELNASNGAVVQTIPVGGDEPAGHLLRRHPRLGGQRPAQHGDRARRLGRVASRVRPVGQRTPERSPRTARTSGWPTTRDSVTELRASNGSLVGTIGVDREPSGVSSDGNARLGVEPSGWQRIARSLSDSLLRRHSPDAHTRHELRTGWIDRRRCRNQFQSLRHHPEVEEVDPPALWAETVQRRRPTREPLIRSLRQVRVQ